MCFVRFFYFLVKDNQQMMKLSHYKQFYDDNILCGDLINALMGREVNKLFMFGHFKEYLYDFAKRFKFHLNDNSLN